MSNLLFRTIDGIRAAREDRSSMSNSRDEEYLLDSIPQILQIK